MRDYTFYRLTKQKEFTNSLLENNQSDCYNIYNTISINWKSGIKDWVLIGIFPFADKWYNAATKTFMAIGEYSKS